jgi:hypothetical protein
VKSAALVLVLALTACAGSSTALIVAGGVTATAGVFAPETESPMRSATVATGVAVFAVAG